MIIDAETIEHASLWLIRLSKSEITSLIASILLHARTSISLEPESVPKAEKNLREH